MPGKSRPFWPPGPARNGSTFSSSGAGVARAADSLFGRGMAKSAAIDVLTRVGDALESTTNGVMKEIGSPAAGVGESGTSPGGIRGRIRAVQSGLNQFVVHGRSSGSRVIGAHADGYGGCAAPDGHRPREALDPGGKRQACRAREPRGPGLAADADGAHPDSRLPRGGPSRAYAEALRPRDEGAPSARLRRAMEVMPWGVLDRYAGLGDERLEKLAAGIGMFTSAPFTFAEYPEVEPTNDSPGRALRYAVVFRDTSG